MNEIETILKKRIYKKHGMSKSRLYAIWENINSRCHRPSLESYKNYGARGIKCLWKSFEEFYKDMNSSYEEHVKKHGEKETQIDRIDNDKSYGKDNCRWVNIHEQQINRRDTLKISVFELEFVLGINDTTLRRWIKTLGLRPALKKVLDNYFSSHLTELLQGLISDLEGEKKILENKRKPLQDKYDSEYRLWFKGIKTPERERILKSFEDGAEGNILFSCSEKIEALNLAQERIKKLIK